MLIVFLNNKDTKNARINLTWQCNEKGFFLSYLCLLFPENYFRFLSG